MHEQVFATFFASVTLTSTRWPLYTNLTRPIPRRYMGCVRMNFVCQSIRKLSSDRQTRQTDLRSKLSTSLCGWSPVTNPSTDPTSKCTEWLWIRNIGYNFDVAFLII